MLIIIPIILVLAFVTMGRVQRGGLDLGDVAVLPVERTENKLVKLSA